MEKNNLYKINGTIYAKNVRTAQGKKDPTVTYEFLSIILEVKRQYKDKTYTELPEFELGNGVSIDDFSVGDNVEITFSLAGKKITDTWHKTTAKALYIKHADTNTLREVGGQTPSEMNKKEEVFVAPLPYSNGNDEDNDLPF